MNELLCFFLQSASCDYSNQIIYDMIYSFYSYEEMKSEEIIYYTLDKQIVTRRHPDRNKKKSSMV